MTADEHVQAGRLEEALSVLQDSVRKQPGDARLRAFLFQLLCVLGQWERALNQLDVLSGLKSESILIARVYQAAIRGEVHRAEVFAGKRSPVIFGEPSEWMSWLVHAGQLVAQGEHAAAAELRDKAFDAAPATPGAADGVAFAWIADADPRLGPVAEVILDGTYYWVPFSRIKSVEFPAPKDLRDLVWCQATFTWTNGGQAAGFIPVRYPGTDSMADGALRLSRKTEWQQTPAGYSLGLGQRLWATDQADLPLLEIRKLELNPAG